MAVCLKKIHQLACRYNKAGLILGLHPANERRRYKVTPSLICWTANLESALQGEFRRICRPSDHYNSGMLSFKLFILNIFCNMLHSPWPVQQPLTRWRLSNRLMKSRELLRHLEKEIWHHTYVILSHRSEWKCCLGKLYIYIYINIGNMMLNVISWDFEEVNYCYVYCMSLQCICITNIKAIWNVNMPLWTYFMSENI